MSAISSSSVDTSNRNVFVFVDPGIGDLQQVLDNAKPGEVVVVLDPHQDAIGQIAQTLADASDVSAIHIIAEGAPGAIDFSSGAVTTADLASHAADLTAIGNALSTDGDILLWGCDTGAGAAGQDFISTLASATGADVAASTDPTGAASLGGNWTLEAQTGPVVAEAPLTQAGVDSFDTLLLSGSAPIEGQQVVTVTEPRDNGETLQSDYVQINDSTTDAAGDRFVTGEFRGHIDFGTNSSGSTVSLFSSTSTDTSVFVVKYNAAGVVQWADNITGTTTANNAYGFTGHSIAVSADGSHVVVGGTYIDTVDLDPGAGAVNLTNNFNYAGFIVNLDGSGAYQWNAHLSGSNSVNKVAIDAAGNVYAAGDYHSGSNFTDSGGNSTALSTDGFSSNFILKLGANGATDWVSTIVSSRGENNATALAVDAAGHVWTAGRFADSTFGGAGGTQLTTANGGFGEYLVEQDSNGNFLTEKVMSGTNLAVAPISINGIAFNATGVVVAGTFFDGAQLVPGSSTAQSVPGVTKTSQSGYTYSYFGSRAFVEQFDATASTSKWLQTETADGISTDGASGLTIDAAGNIVVVGYLQRGIDGYDFQMGANATTATFGGTDVALTSNINAFSNFASEGYVWTLKPGTSSATTLSAGSFIGTGDVTPSGVSALADGVAVSLNIVGPTDTDPGAGTSNVGAANKDGGAFVLLTGTDLGEVPPNANPVVDLNGATAGPTTLAYIENDAATAIAPTATVTDSDSADFNGGSLRVAFTTNGTAADQLSIENQGISDGQIGISGANVTYGGNVIGTFTGGTDGADLVITFTTANATPAAVQALEQHILYANNSEDPASAARTVTFTVNDGDGGTGTDTATINLTAVNDAPVVTVPSIAYTGFPTTPVGITNISFSDVDAHGGIEQVTFTVGGGVLNATALSGITIVSGDGTGTLIVSGLLSDLNSFISGGHLSFTGQTSTSLSVSIDDLGHTPGPDQTDSGSVAITLDIPPSTPVDTDAANDSAGINGSVAEGAMAGTLVGITALSTDADGGTVSYSLTGDANGAFVIDASTGVVTVADPSKIDYESAPGHAYTITVQADDGQGATSTQDFVIGVTDVDPLQPVDSDAASNSVAEDASAGTVVGVTAHSTDVNGPAVTYSLTGDADGAFAIDSATGVVTVADPGKIDYETAPGHAYTITVEASDGTLTSSQNFDIAVSDVNDNAPVITTDSTQSVAENQIDVAVLSSTDVDTVGTNPAVFSVTGGADAALFTVVTVGGVQQLQFVAARDYETQAHSYQVEVTASDGVNTSVKQITVNLTDTNDTAPVITSGATATEAENTAASEVVYQATATDADSTGEALMFALAGADAALFNVDAATGAVTFKTAPDFEAPADTDHNNVYDIDVTASDGLHVTHQAVAISVTGVNEAPMTAAAAETASGKENSVIGGTLLTGSDPEHDPLTFKLVADSAQHGTATLDNVTGAYSFTPDHDYHGAATFSYVVNDGQLDSAAKAVSITVVNPVAPAGTVDLGVHPGAGVVEAVGDFNGDGTSDVLFRDPATGHVDVWQLVDGHWQDSTDLGATHGSTDWVAKGAADLNGDGTSDVLWFNTKTGQVDEWQMQNGNWAKSIDFGATHGSTDWQIAGTGDFNGDGTSDVLWFNAKTGQVDEWQMQNGNWAKSIDLGATHGSTDWQIAGTGDFNGDGTSDVLWFNSKTGQVDEWQMQNGHWAKTFDFGATHGSTDWQVAGIGDANADGTSDVLWLNSKTGAMDVWKMADGNWSGSFIAESLPANEQVAGIGLVNQDHTADVLLHNTQTGDITVGLNMNVTDPHFYDLLT